MRDKPLDPRVLAHIRKLEAEGILTKKEVDAYAHHAAGHGYRSIARQFGISFSTARDRVQRAKHKITTSIEESPDAA